MNHEISYYDEAGNYAGGTPPLGVYSNATVEKAEAIAAVGTNCGIEVHLEDGEETIRDRESGFEL